MIRPVVQLAAGHRPAELIPEGVHPRTVIIVQPAPRSLARPITLFLLFTTGSVAVLVMVLLVLQAVATTTAAIAAAAPSVGGVSLSLKLARKGSTK